VIGQGSFRQALGLSVATGPSCSLQPPGLQKTVGVVRVPFCALIDRRSKRERMVMKIQHQQPQTCRPSDAAAHRPASLPAAATATRFLPGPEQPEAQAPGLYPPPRRERGAHAHGAKAPVPTGNSHWRHRHETCLHPRKDFLKYSLDAAFHSCSISFNSNGNSRNQQKGGQVLLIAWGVCRNARRPPSGAALKLPLCNAVGAGLVSPGRVD